MSMAHPPTLPAAVHAVLRRGVVIPAHPLALDRDRRLDERRQMALTRYYLEAGAGGVAVGVHSTQFAIREPHVGLLRPVLELAAGQVRRHAAGAAPTVLVAGVCGPTDQAVREAGQARELGYHCALLSLAALRDAGNDEMERHCRAVAAVLPLFGFYLQPSVGGRVLDVAFWRRFAAIDNVVAIKIAPFNRFQTLDVIRAVAEVGRAGDVALYTGNDDNILADLLGDWTFDVGGRAVTQRVVGGLLGHWAYWTRAAVELLARCHAVAARDAIPRDLLVLNRQVTDMNAAVFDPAHGYAGCIPGMHEVLRRQGLLAGTWCLDPDEGLSPGQAGEITRVCAAYPHLVDDGFVAARRDRWLGG